MQQPIPKTTELPDDSARLTLVIERSKEGAHAPDPASSSVDIVIELPKGGTDAPDPALADAGAPRPLSRPPIRLIAGRWAVGAAALAVLAILGYQVYKKSSFLDRSVEKMPLSTAVSGEATEHRGPGVSGNFGRDAAARDGSVAKIDQDVAPLAAPTSPSRAVPRDVVRTPVEPPRASRPVAAAREIGKQVAPRAEPCTAAIAAIGLCSPQPAPAAQAVTAGTGNAHLQDRVARNTVERAQSPAVPCTAGVAALGLCAAESIQRKE